MTVTLDAAETVIHSGAYKIVVRVGGTAATAVRTAWGWHVAQPPKTLTRWLYQDKGRRQVAVKEYAQTWQALPDRDSTIQFLIYRAAGWSW